jgi:hypothetical protein
MLPRCLIVCTLLLTSSLGGAALSFPDLSRFGHNLTVEPQQTVHDLTCFLCSASIDGHVTGSVQVFAGNVFLNGKVEGNVLVFGGNVSLTGRAETGGQVLIFGGHLHDGSAGLAHPPRVFSALIFLPLAILLCLVMGALIVLTRRMTRGPAVYPPLPRL